MVRVGILHFASPPVIGGVEATIYHHACLLAERGYPVRVVSGRGESFHTQVEFVHVEEISSRHPDVLAAGADLAAGRVTPVFDRLRDRLREKLTSALASVDVCLVHNALSLHKNLALTAALHELAGQDRLGLVAWCHDFAWLDQLYLPDLHPGYPWDLLRTPWPGVRYVTVSEHRRRRLAGLLDLPEDQIEVITPGVPVEDFLKLSPDGRQIANRLNLLSADPLMLLPARVTRRKNIEFAIRVTAAMLADWPAVALVVTGPPGPHNPTNLAYLQSLSGLADQLGVTDRVHFLYRLGQDGRPFLASDELLGDLYQLADLMIFPSRREGFGIPVLEAALARVPVFAADIPPIQESTAGQAILFDPGGDPHEVAGAIRAYLEADQAYQLRRRVLARYTWRAVIEGNVIPLIEEFSNHGHT